MRIKPLWVLIALLILFGGGYYLLRHYFVDEEKVVCIQEAKQCPDGSYVGREGSNCEFAECPDVSLGKCIPKFKVASGPEFTASEAYSSECTSKTSQSDCERVDTYNKANGNFGNADGTPDCKWTEESSKIDTSSWKTYRNETLGFEVRYPQNFEIWTGLTANSIIMGIRGAEEFIFIQIPSEEGHTDKNCKDSMLGGENFQRCETYVEVGGFMTSRDVLSWVEKSILIRGDHNGWPLIINFRAKEEKEDLFQIFETVLSTFKFIK